MEEEEPPDHESAVSSRNRSSDKKQILLLADVSLNEMAVCNPAVCAPHFIYRVREKTDNRYGERSLIKYQKLINPYKLSGNPRTIIASEHEWELDGVEDARISKNGLYHIVYTAFNQNEQDGGARIALATTEDFKKIKKEGIIGSPIRLEEAVKLVGGANSYYGKQFAETLDAVRHGGKASNPYIMDKDATIVYNVKGKPILLHRMGNAIQAMPFDTLNDLKNEGFWRYKMSELEKDTILYPGEKWASEKVGLGGTPINIEGRIIGHIHGVKKIESKKKTIYIYNSTFAEFDPETYHIRAILRSPVFKPSRQLVLTESGGEKIIKKYVNFATGMTIDPDNPSIICNYSGIGDQGIELRTNNLKQWLLTELSNPHNHIANWQRTLAA